MTEKTRSADVREALRRGDPAGGETGLSPAEAQAMRRAMLSAAPAERRPLRLVPAFAAAAVAALSFAVILGLWKMHEPQPIRPVQQTQVTPPETAAAPPAEAPAQVIAERAVPSPPAIPTARRLHTTHRPTARVAQAHKAPVHSVAEEPEETSTRQVQFSTPGGTRIIWLLPEKS